MYTISTKRLLALALAVCLVLGCFAGCGRKKTEKPSEPETIPPQLILDPTEAPTEATEEATTEATEAPTESTKETEAKGLPGEVAGDSVNVRSGPGTNYNTSATLPIGTKVHILDADLSTSVPWGKIEDGWICLNYVKLDNPDELLQYTTGELGISLKSGIPLYNGPGEFYGKAGTLGKDVRLNIFGIVGRWAKIAEGWLLLDYIYIDCTEGPEEPVMGTVTGSGVNIRSGPGTHYTPVTAVNKGTRLKIFYIVDYYGYKWGCGEVGWISMEYVLLDNDPAAELVGTWCGHHSTDQASDTSHIFVEWKFTAGGTYTCTQWAYDEGMTGASQAVKISSSNGKFTFDGTKLTMNDKDVAYTLANSKLHLDVGYGSKAHLKGSMDDAIKAFLAEKYPGGNPNQPENPETPEQTDPPAPPAIDQSIVGSWNGAKAYNSADGVLCFTMGDNWTFNSDGTFQLTENTTFWVYNQDGTLGQVFESTPVKKSGTFTFDGTNLVITLSDGTKGSGTASVQNGVLVVRWGSGSQNLHKGSAAELAAKLFPGT